jgi:hypothetical protein
VSAVRGLYLVYASGVFEQEVKTLAGVHRMAAKLARLGFCPSAKQHMADGVRCWNEPVEIGTYVPAPRRAVPSVPVRSAWTTRRDRV